MDLIAISYYNIWPFKDNIINIFFDRWKFLIRSPIGSGKSFLFFDGPTYALYKNTGRNVLNVDSKSGFIKLLFEIEWQKYLIVRNLSEWKTKDVCKSQLFSITNLQWIMDNENGKDIEYLLKKSGVIIEEITFKNERDLDGNLSEFLPPREVFLSTVFLLQDSENIFELQAAERLIVMKNIFNLIGIDEIKEQIANKRRDIQTTLKIKSDTSNSDSKIKSILHEYINNFNNISSMDCLKTSNNLGNENSSDITFTLWNNLKQYKEFIQELESISEKVNINEFGIESFDKNINIQISNYIWEQKKQYQEYFVKSQNTKDQIKNKIDNLNILKNEVWDINNKIEVLDKKLSQIDPELMENKKREKLMFIKNAEDLIKLININIEIPEKLKSIITKNPLDIEEFNHMIIDVISRWQNFSDQKKLIESKIENEKLKHEWNIKTLEAEIKNLIEKKKSLQEQVNNLNVRIWDLTKTINEESQFECIKINSYCPFIKDINKKTFDELEKQKNSFENEKINIEIKLKEIDEILVNRQKWLWSNWEIENSEIKNLEDENKRLEETIIELRNFLAEIDFKNIQNVYQEWRTIQSKISILDNAIIELEIGQNEIVNHKEEKIKKLQQMENKNTDMEKILIDIKNLQEIELKQNEIMQEFNILNIEKIEKINKNMENNIRDLEILIDDFKWSQIELAKLKQEEKIVKDLYQIFSKELLLFVLEWYLPILTDIINSFLSQVVEYTIDIKLLQKNDNLEMDVRVYDEKWERDIKSLSGWQKVILKLVWMLAISSYMKSPILFLDETINNLDNDTVGKVANMLSDFVKQRDLKLYTVTHSQQIQEMDIWDKIIHIEDMV